MNALNESSTKEVSGTATGQQTENYSSTVRFAAGGWCRAMMLMAAFAMLLLAVGVAQAQTIRRITSPGKFYVDDKQGAGIVYNYAVYMVSNNTASTIPSAYVVMTNLIATNLISLSTNDSGVRPLGVLAPGQTKMAAFFLKGPGFTGNADSLYNTTNETHTIRVYNGPPGVGTALVSSNYAFTNIIYMIEALANKITIITNLNPIAPLGSDVDLVIGGDTGTIGGNNSLFFSPAVLGSWRPDSYELKETIVRFTENPTFTNQLFFDPSISGFTNFTGQLYTNTLRFRAIKVTSTNLPVSPFAFIDSGSGTKHTAVSSLATSGGSNVVISVINRVVISSQTVTPSSLLAPGGTVTYSITFSNYASTVDLSEIRNTLAGFPGAMTYVPGSATYNALPITDPSISGQNLLWALPFTVASNSAATLTFQANVPLASGLYTNSTTAILGVEQIDTTLVTTDNSPSRSVLTVIPVSDMGVGKTGPANIFASSNFNYTISVTNFGPSPNTSFAVTDSLPASVTFISATPPAITNGNLVVWTNLGTLAANAFTNLTITVRAPANAAGLTNTATVGGPTNDPNSTNNVTPPVITTSVTNRPPVAVNDTTPAVNGVAQVFNPLTNDSDPDGDAFIIQSVSFSGGTVSINSGATNITFTVTNNSNGSISYTIIDTRGGTSTAIISITGLNVAPVANNQSISINEDVSTNLVLTATDDGTNLLFTILSGPANGALTGFNGTSGAVTYTPSTNYIGADSFTFTASDGILSSTGTVSITVSAINDPPIANNQTFTMPEDTSTNVVLTASDVDSTNLVFAILVGPTNGTLGVLNPNTGVVSFTPNTNFAGNDGFTFTVFDGQLYATGFVFSITINPLNDAPLANSQSVTNNEDTVFGITLTGSDVDGPVTNFVLSTLPLHGTLSGSGANLTYTPNTNNYNGPDSFTFTVNDGSLTSAVATVSITLLPVNDPPVIVNDTITVTEDSTNSIPVLVNDSDPDGNPLTITSVTTTNGIANVVGTNVVYTPSPNFNGTNTLTYCATDGLATNCASITVIVTPVNDAPIANNQSVGTPEDTLLNVVVTGSDVDSANLVYSVLVGPLNGSLGALNANSGAVTYLPATNYTGPDIFTFTVSDGSLLSTGTVSIVVGGINDNPLIVPDIATINEDSISNIINVLVNDFDIDGDPMSIVSVTTTNGTAFISGTNVVYTPPANFNGTNVMTYCATDGLDTNCATITVTVLPINDAPVANSQSVGTPEDILLNVVVSGSDIDSASLIYSILTGPANGTLGSLNTSSGAVAYTPSTNYIGADSFTFTVFDGSMLSTGTVSITVSPVNDAPVANNQSITTPEDTSTNLVLTASDVDNTNLVFAILTNPGNGSLGTLNTNTGAVTYSPSNNFNGADSFTFTVFDGSLFSTGTVAITVTPINDPPVIIPDIIIVTEDSTNTIPVIVNDTDPDGDPLTPTSVTTTNGTAVISGTNVVYTPSTNFFGTNVMTYCATDGLVTNCATITVIVTPVNDAPLANSQSVSTSEDIALPITLTGSDVDGPVMNFVVGTSPANGTLSGTGANLTYTPGLNYNGSDSFTFTVNDGSLTSAVATVSITVSPANDGPVVVNDIITVTEDSTNTIPVLVNDSDPDGNPLTITSVTTTNGTATVVGTNVIYTPSQNFNGTNTLTYCATDGLITNCASITVIVTPVNDGPLANNQNVGTPEDTLLNVVVTGSDIDSTPIVFAILTSPINGALGTLDANSGAVTYLPSTNYVGPDMFTFTVSDGSLLSTGTVSITVGGVNDNPLIVPDIATVNEDSTGNIISVLVNDFDIDNDPITLVSGSVITTNGTATIAGTNVVYTPSANFNGTNVMTYCATDGNMTNCATITVTVLPINDAPVANNQGVTMPEDTSTNLVLTASDIDSSSLVFAILTGPANGSLGSLNANSGAVTYTPANNYNGADSFTFTVSDGSLLSTGTVSITVTPVNDAPVAVNDNFTAQQNITTVFTPSGVLSNDTDTENNTLTASIVTTPANGVVALNSNGGFVYTSTNNFIGTDTFTYIANDGTNNSAPATVSILVTPLADVIVTKTGPTNVNPSQTFTYTINVANAGPSSASNVVVIDTLPVNLTFVSASAGGVNNSGIVTWPTLMSLAVNASTNFTVTVTAPTNGSFVNIASASATTEDLNLTNNNGSASGSRVTTAVVPIAFGIRAGANVFNPQTGLFEQTVTVTNTSGTTASAIRLLAWNFTTLTNGAPRTNVWLWNYHGTANDGRRYVQYNGGVNPGAWVTFHLEYYAPTRVPFTNSLEAQVTLPVPATTNLSGGVLIDVAFADNTTPGNPRFVIEWASIIGRNYTVIYGPTANGPWTAATPTVTATATRVQWYDDGPPKTASEPLNGSRYYRVILNPINN